MSKENLREKISSEIHSRLNKVISGFTKYYAPDIPEDILWHATCDFMCWEDEKDILAVVDTTLSKVCDEGIVFTTEAFHYKNGNNMAESFSYNEIENLRVIPHWYGDDLEIDVGYESIIGSTLYKKTELKSLLYKICSLVREEKANSEKAQPDLKIKNENLSGGEIAGTILGSVSATSTAYSYDKFATPQGHGFAAEKANHMYDKIRGHDAEILGDDNTPNGADRSVDGILIQSKYCMSGTKCINECFDKQGNFRYSGMQIEVPSDMYDEAVSTMQDKIRQGQVKGIKDPMKASEIIRKGNYTYQQAKNIAKAGNIDSIKFDAQNGIITGIYAGGISAAISFAVSIWNGENFDDAVINAGMSFLKVGGTSAVTSLCVSQLSKAGLNSFLVPTTDLIVKAIGPKASAVLANAFRSGQNIYGAAAMKSASKLLRGNLITAAISTAILSTFLFK